MTLIVAFAGHRPNKLGGYGPSLLQTRLRVELKRQLLELGVTHAISGMAVGWDQWSAETCTELSIPWLAAVPFPGQEARWPHASREHYRALLKKARVVHYVTDGPYAIWKMQLRNEWMVDNCQTLLSCFDGTDGGTANCVDYARRVGRRIVNINPRDFA